MENKITKDSNNSSKSGYIVSMICGSIAGLFMALKNNAQSGAEIFGSVLGGIFFVMIFSGTISGLIYLFNRKNFQKKFTIVSIIICIMGVIGNMI